LASSLNIGSIRLLNSCLVSVKCQTRVEDYLPAGNALGYNENWQYRYSGEER
jgi:hypothetical protein